MRCRFLKVDGLHVLVDGILKHERVWLHAVGFANYSMDWTEQTSRSSFPPSIVTVQSEIPEWGMARPWEVDCYLKTTVVQIQNSDTHPPLFKNAQEKNNVTDEFGNLLLIGTTASERKRTGVPTSTLRS